MKKFCHFCLISLIVTSILWLTSCGQDEEPPSPPFGLQIKQVGDRALLLTWSASKEEDLIGYNVYRSTTSKSGYFRVNSELIDISSNPSYQDSSDLVAGKVFYYVVTAVDESGNESDYSSEANILVYLMIHPGIWKATGVGELKEVKGILILFDFLVSDDRKSIKTDGPIVISYGHSESYLAQLTQELLKEQEFLSLKCIFTPYTFVCWVPNVSEAIAIDIKENSFSYKDYELELKGTFDSEIAINGTWSYNSYSLVGEIKGVWEASYID